MNWTPDEIQKQFIWHMSLVAAVPMEHFLEGDYTQEQRERIVGMIRWGGASTKVSSSDYLNTVNQWNMWGIGYDEIMYRLILKLGYPQRQQEEGELPEDTEDTVYIERGFFK